MVLYPAHARIRSLLRYSLQCFQKPFTTSIDTSPKSEGLEERRSVITFIAYQTGQAFVQPPAFDTSNSFADLVSTTPLIFILSPGTDVIAFADKLGMLKRFESVSFWRGQGPKAMKLLSNCHLEAIVEQFKPESMQNSFRLWLASMPAESFPVQVLQNGVKMTSDPPSGLRANLIRSYSALSDELLKESKPPKIFKTLLFGFCYFHSAVQDRRRKFGPIGCNIACGFAPEDLQVCRQQLLGSCQGVCVKLA